MSSQQIFTVFSSFAGLAGIFWHLEDKHSRMACYPWPHLALGCWLFRACLQQVLHRHSWGPGSSTHVLLGPGFPGSGFGLISFVFFTCLSASSQMPILIYELHLWEKKVKVKSLSCVRLFATPWTVTYQAPWSMGFSRQESWSGVPFPSPGDLPHPGVSAVGTGKYRDFASIFGVIHQITFLATPSF